MEQHLIDTSVWIDFLNAAPGAARETFRELAQDPDAIVTTEPVVMELRVGVTGMRLLRIESTLNRFAGLTIDPSVDFHAAADLYRVARSTGNTVRSMVDCLIAAVAVRTETVLVHKDRDFEVLGAIAPDLRSKSCIPT